jgi:ribonuclease R
LRYIILCLRLFRGIERALNRREKKAHENPNDRDDDKQLNNGKAPGGSQRAHAAERVKPVVRRSKHFLAQKAPFARKANVAREKKPSGECAKDELRSRITALLTKRALNKIEISKSLGLPIQQRAKLRELLREMEVGGEIARVRKDRYVLPQDADLVTGTIHFYPTGSARVLREKAGQPDLYVSAEDTFTAMHGDRVVARLIIEPLEPAEWKPGRPEKPPRRRGRVIRILERANETIVGTLQKSRNFYFVVADDPRFVHNLYVPAPSPPLSAGIGDKVVAQLDTWPSRHVNPEGHVVEVLGPAGSPGVDMLSIVRKYRLPGAFPPEVLREAETLPPGIEAEDLEHREDLRSRFIFTIDPDDARDFDDAVEVERIPDGWRVGVHIADVSHYVPPRSGLDREAVSRGNSVYLADRVIPMLPEVLSNGLCSLRPKEDHLTFSVFAEISRNGKVRSARFAKTVIRSAARLTYKQAYAHLRRPPHDALTRHLHVAWELASLLRRQRFAAGSLDLEFPEVKVWLDAQGKPLRIERIENDTSHQLIEELMLLANELTARELARHRQPSIYRIHEKPDPEKLLEFRETVLIHGIECGDLSHRPELEKLLGSIRGKPQEYAIKLGLLKSLKRARYHPQPLGHYGLNKSNYTHFTSPIRRYSDLVVHRAMGNLLGLTKRGPDSSALPSISEHLSTTERIAADAEKDSVKLKKLEYFQDQVSRREKESFGARILEVRNYGLLIELPDFLMNGLVHVSSLDGDFFILDAPRARLIGRRSRRVFQVGDEIQVQVARVDFFKQQVDFQPA